MVKWGCAGFILGAWFGLLARLWMRLVTVNPSFSWAATLGVIALAAVGGLGLGITRGARLTDRIRWWKLTSLLALPFLAAPQGLGIFLVGCLVGGWALAGRGSLWARLIPVVLLIVGLAGLGQVLATPEDRPFMDGTHWLALYPGLWTLLIPLAVAGRELFLPWPAPAPLRRA